jgi:hypothetical protein
METAAPGEVPRHLQHLLISPTFENMAKSVAAAAACDKAAKKDKKKDKKEVRSGHDACSASWDTWQQG